MEKDPTVARGAPDLLLAFRLSRRVGGAVSYIRSMIAAMPCPPPMHIVMSP